MNIVKHKDYFNLDYLFAEERWLPWSNGGCRVSSYGRVVGIGGRILKPGPCSCGYPKVWIKENGKRKTKTVHRLVGNLFLPTRPRGMEINHIDGNKWNNHVRNLEWTTHLDNMRHASALGLMGSCKGSKNGKAKLTERQVRDIRKLEGTMTQRELGMRYGIGPSCIRMILRRKSWKHI